MQAVFDALRTTWGSLDFVVHAIAFSDKAELKGRYADTSRENFVAHHADLVLLLHRGGADGGRADAGGRQPADAHLWRLDARHAELQRHGRRQGGAGGVRALSRRRFRRARHPRQRHLRRPDPHARRRRGLRRAAHVQLSAGQRAAAPGDRHRGRRRRGALPAQRPLARGDRRGPLRRLRLQYRRHAAPRPHQSAATRSRRATRRNRLFSHTGGKSSRKSQRR